MTIEQQIKQKAIDLGFDLIGITSSGELNPMIKNNYNKWLKNGYAADMQYLQKNIEKRFNAEKLLEGANSVICAAVAYKKVIPSESADCHICSYACFEDYHIYITKRLWQLSEFIAAKFEHTHKFKVCADTVPIQERAYAQRARLGFIGKNRMLINEEFGSRLLLGEIITTAPLCTDKPFTGSCGDCTECIKACPRNALTKDGIDCRKCINYHTIESKNQLPEDFRKLASTHLYGCEICIDVCPYNKATSIMPKIPQIIDSGFSKEQILGLDKENFNHLFGKTVVKRRGLERLKAVLED